jgi:hypothetical protein
MLIAAIGLLTVDGMCQAQPSSTPAPLPPRAGGTQGFGGGFGGPGTSPEPSIDNVTFKGGTAQELVDALEKTIGQKPNVILTPSLTGIEIPPFELHNVTLGDIFMALNLMASAGREEWTWTRSPSSAGLWTLIPAKQQTQPQPGLAYFAQNQPPPPGSLRAAQIFNVSAFLDFYKIEDITTAIETAWNMLKSETPAEMKFHKDTHLLIAVGNGQQISVISQVLQELGKSADLQKKVETPASGSLRPELQSKAPAPASPAKQ